MNKPISDYQRAEALKKEVVRLERKVEVYK